MQRYIIMDMSDSATFVWNSNYLIILLFKEIYEKSWLEYKKYTIRYCSLKKNIIHLQVEAHEFELCDYAFL